MMPAPMNNPLIDGMMNKLRSDPMLSKNPLAQNLFTCLQSGDSKKGEEIAMNLCKTYGIAPEEACKQAMQFFTRR